MFKYQALFCVGFVLFIFVVIVLCVFLQGISFLVSFCICIFCFCFIFLFVWFFCGFFLFVSFAMCLVFIVACVS